MPVLATLMLLAAVDRPVIDLSGGRVQPLAVAIAPPFGAAEPAASIQTVLGQDFDRCGHET